MRMRVKPNHIQSLKQITLILLVFFALSPCIVKGAWFEAVNLEYVKPSNKAKTNFQTSNCEFSQDKIQQIQVSVSPDLDFPFDETPFNFEAFFGNVNQSLSKTEIFLFRGKSPPKYILYKRLKLDLI